MECTIRSLENILVPTYSVERRSRSDNFRKAAILGSNSWPHIVSLPIPVKTGDGFTPIKEIQPEGRKCAVNVLCVNILSLCVNVLPLCVNVL